MAKTQRKKINFFRIKEPSFQGVATGNLATMELPTGFTYYKTDMVCYDAAGVLIPAANMAAELGNVTIKANGRSFIDQIPASVLLAREAYYNEKNLQAGVNQDGILPLRFAIESFVSLPERSLFAVGSANLNSLTMEVEILGVNVSRIDVISYKSDEIRDFGTHIAIRRYNRSFTGTGDYDESKLPDSIIDGAYRTLFIDEGAGAIDNVIVWKDNTRIFEEVPAVLNSLDQLEAGRSPQAGFYILDFGINNTITSRIEMPMADWRQRIKWNVLAGAPAQFSIYAEMYEGMTATVALTTPSR